MSEMKKIKFLVNVPDKYTKEQYTENQTKEFEDERADEILSAIRKNGRPYAVLVEDKTETAEKNIGDSEDLKENKVVVEENNKETDKEGDTLTEELKQPEISEEKEITKKVEVNENSTTDKETKQRVTKKEK